MRLFRSSTRPGHTGRRAAAASLAAVIATASLGAFPAGAHAAPQSSAPRVQFSVNGHRAQARRGCVNANTTAVAASSRAIRTAVVCLINQQRTRRGLPAFRISWRLDHSAQAWTNAMVSSQSFAHGSDFAARITAAGFSWQAAGENIATGYPTPAAVVSGWMASPGHCQNILSPTYSHIGTGLSRHPVKPYGTVPATWTQDFALPMHAHAPSSNWGPSRGCPT